MQKYVFVIPTDPATYRGPENQQFMLSKPNELDKIKAAAIFWGNVHLANEEDIKIVPLYMNNEDYKKIAPLGTVHKKVADEFLKQNELCKPEIKSLKKLAAKTLAENPLFFKAEKATKEANDEFKEAVTQIEKNCSL